MLTTDQLLGKGRYRIISNFTHDDRGGLYEAYDTVSNTNVVLRETVGSTGGVMTPTQLDKINNAFVGEAKVLREVKHESLLNVQDFFSEIDRHYLVMESVDGSDLTKFLLPDEKMPALGDILKWADQILDALHYLHTLPTPLIHRDITPSNIRLTSNFKVKLLTAGIDTSDVIMAAAENPTGSSVLNYRPLEQLWGGLDPASQKVITNHYDDRSRRILQQPLDARSDIYSVGATLYHVMTRTLPKDALERSIELLDGNTDPLVPPAELDPAIPEEISEVIMKSMEIRREHRYDSAAIMRQVLDAARQKLQVLKTSEPKPRPAPEPISEVETVRPTEKNVTLHPTAKAAPPPPAAQRSENKAAIEQKRAEDRQREIKSDLDRQRKESERIKAAVVKEALSSTKLDETTDEQFLLEVEPVAQSSDNFEWSVDISEEASVRSIKPRGLSDDDFDFNIAPAPRSNVKVLAAGGAGLVIVLAVVGWLFIGGSAPSEPPRAQVPAVREVEQPQQQDAVPVSSFADPSSAQSTDQPADQPTQLNQTTPNEIESQQAATQSKTKKPAPAPAKPAEKKKVTVDDLINDN